MISFLILRKDIKDSNWFVISDINLDWTIFISFMSIYERNLNSLGMIELNENDLFAKLYLEAGAAHVDVGHYEVPVAGEVSVPAHAPLVAHGLGAGAAVTV